MALKVAACPEGLAKAEDELHELTPGLAVPTSDAVGAVMLPVEEGLNDCASTENRVGSIAADAANMCHKR